MSASAYRAAINGNNKPNRSSKGGGSGIRIPEVPRAPSPCTPSLITSVPSPHPISLASISSIPYPQTKGIPCPPDNPFASPKSQDFRLRGSLKNRLDAPSSRLLAFNSQLSALTDPSTGRGLASAPVEQNQKHTEGSTPQYSENSRPPDNPFASPESQDFRSRGSLKSRLEAHRIRRRLPLPDPQLSTLSS